MTKEQSVIFYIITFFISASLLSITLKHIKNKRLKNTMIIIALSIPIIISGIRYGVGTDYFSYRHIFFEMNYTEQSFFSLILNCEPFHIILCKILGGMSNGYVLMFFVYALATVFFSYKAIQKQKENISIFHMFFFYLLVYFPYSFNGVREALAIAIVFYAFSYLKMDNYNIKRAIMINLLAVTVHYGSLIALIFIVLWHLLKKHKNREMIIIFIYIIIVVAMYMFAIFVTENTDVDSVFYKFTKYLVNKEEEIDIGIGLLVLRLPIIALLMLFGKRLKEENKDINLYISLYMTSIVLLYLSYLNIALGRFANYFTMIETILIPTFIKIPESKNYQLLAKAILIIYILFQYTYVYYYTTASKIFPYTTIF